MHGGARRESKFKQHAQRRAMERLQPALRDASAIERVFPHETRQG
jgi:hypothetical protein